LQKLQNQLQNINYWQKVWSLNLKITLDLIGGLKV